MRNFLALILVTAQFMPPMLWAQARRAPDETAQAIQSQVAVVDLWVPEAHLVHRHRLRRHIIAAFAEDPRVRMIPEAALDRWRLQRVPTTPKQDPADELKYAREHLVAGKRAYGELNFQKAVTELLTARRDLIRKLHLLRSNRDLLDAHLYLGMAYMALEKEAKARAEFRRVVYLDPGRRLSTREYSPEVVASFATARQRVMEADPVRVRVESEPSGGSVFLNGRRMGRTPLRLRFQPGDYFLLVEKEGRRSWYDTITLKRRVETVRATLQVEEDAAAVSYLFRTREGSDQQSSEFRDVKDLASRVGAHLVFLGTLEKFRSTYRMLGQLYDRRAQEFSKVAVATIGPDLRVFPASAADLVETLLGFVQPTGYLATGAAEEGQMGGLTVGGQDRPDKDVSVSRKPKKKWYQHWWIYPLIGGIGVGTYFGARELGSAGQSSKIVINNKGNF